MLQGPTANSLAKKGATTMFTSISTLIIASTALISSVALANSSHPEELYQSLQSREERILYRNPVTGSPLIGVITTEKRDSDLLCRRNKIPGPHSVPKYDCYQPVADSVDSKEKFPRRNMNP
jgi:hypothetical protein